MRFATNRFLEPSLTFKDQALLLAKCEITRQELISVLVKGNLEKSRKGLVLL